MENKFKIGNKIKIISITNAVNYVLNRNDNDLTDKQIKVLKAYCSLKTDKEYKIIDYCRACKIVYIKSGSYSLMIKTKNIV